MNPFTPGRTVDPQFFAGRKEELERFRTFLKSTREGNPMHLAIVKETRLPANKVAYLRNRLHDKDCVRKVARGRYRLFHGLFKEYLKRLR